MSINEKKQLLDQIKSKFHNINPGDHRQLAVRILSKADEEQKKELRFWIEHILAIKASDHPDWRKAKHAIAFTASNKVMVSIAKLITEEIKDIAWDNRSLKGKVGIVGSLLGLTVFGWQGAGIAALGTAIGVPLWVVLGAGGVFLVALYEEITGGKKNFPGNYL